MFLKIIASGVSFFLFAGVLWVPKIQVFHNHNIFLSLDTVILLGLSLLCGLLFTQFESPAIVKRLEHFFLVSRNYILLIVLIVLPTSLLITYFTNQVVLNSFLSSADEHSCYFLSECLRKGRLWVEPHAISNAFNVVHVGNVGGKWFSVYPPGWPLIWAIGLHLNIADFLNPLISSLALLFFFLSGRKVFGQATAFWAIVSVTFSPFFVFTSSSYFSHSTCMLMVAIFLYGYLKWMDASTSDSRLMWGTIACAAVGYGLITRYLTMSAMTFPFLVYLYGLIIFRKRSFHLSDVLGPVIIILFIGIVFYQNYNVTGNIFLPPNKYDKPGENLGFSQAYTPLDGIVFIIARFFYLMDWAPPLIILIFVLSITQKLQGTSTYHLYRYSFLYLVLGYFFYFSWGGNQWGPRYYYEGIVLLYLTSFDAIRNWWNKGSAELKKFLVGLILMAIVSNFHLFIKQALFTREASAERKSLYKTANNQIKKNAVVLIRGFIGNKLVLSQEDAVRNNPFLKGKILYAHDRGESNKELMRFYADRIFYLGEYDRKLNKPKLTRLLTEQQGVSQS